MDDVKSAMNNEYVSTSQAPISDPSNKPQQDDSHGETTPLVPKKARFDFYKAIQNADYHTVGMRKRLETGQIPEKEADSVVAYIESLIGRLQAVREDVLKQA